MKFKTFLTESYKGFQPVEGFYWKHLRAVDMHRCKACRDILRETLKNAGFTEGRFQRMHKRDDTEQTVPGFVIDSLADYEHPDGAQVVRYYVTHAGPGRTKALAQYLEVLQKHGVEATMGPANFHKKQPVVLVSPPIT